MRRKLILVIGNHYFGSKLVAELKKQQKSLLFLALDPSSSFRDRLIYTLLVPFADLVWSISGSLEGGLSLKLATFLKKKILQLFIGTDVLQTAEAVKEGRIYQPLLNQSILRCNAPWLADEMRQLGFSAPYISDYVYGIPERPEAMPQKFSILTYVVQGKEELYGMPWVIACARLLPDVTIRIVGMNQSTRKLPSNVELLGRVSMQKEIKEASVLLRLTSHDGMGHTVIEGLAAGRWVIRTNKMPEVIYVRDESEFLIQIQAIYDQFKRGSLECNFAGYEYVKREFNREKVVTNLVNMIHEAM